LPEVTLRQALIRAGFPYSRHGQRVHSLSGGERARLLFLALSLASHHLLWLDEPTNHLDLEGKEDLAEALSRFAGGVLLISHDRDLIERSCNRFWVIREGRIVEAHSAERAYAELLCDEPMDLSISPATTGSPQEQATVEDDEEALLARWYELDALLAADLARKPRHQTPRLQQQWRDELQQLAGLLGLAAN
ncbi:MAG: ABC transporter ATP-binding protein, partial [Aeromonas salmonicida]